MGLMEKLFGKKKTLTPSNEFRSSSTVHSKEFKQLSKTLGNIYPIGDPRFDSEIEKRELARNRLFALVQADPEIRNILDKYGGGIDLVQKIYTTLINVGAGQWAGSVCVPAAAIATPYTLNYLLRELGDKELPIKGNIDNQTLEIVWNVLNYFKTGELIKDTMYAKVSDADYATAQRIHSVLQRYVEIDDDFWLKSATGVADYRALSERLYIISKELWEVLNIISAQNTTQKLMFRYANALSDTIGSLRDICGNLALVAKGRKDVYPLDQYQSDIAFYKSMVENYRKLGSELSVNMFGY